jgi:AraC family transcriptional regulator of adaptative response / DNA-3-methyladenine glycosylase II
VAADAPGLRVPGALDGFEIAVRAIAAQQMPHADARLILSRVADRVGTTMDAPHALNRAFPPVNAFARLPVAALEDVGMTRAHAQAIVAVANEVSSERVALEPAAPLEETLAALRRIHGIGEWAVQYIAMRSLGWPNAFPDGATASALERRASAWQPWRAYASVHLWNHSEEALQP